VAQVTVKMFANLKELAGADSMVIDCDDGTSLENVISIITGRLPGLKDILEARRVFISINQDMAQKDDIVKDGDEVALLPPFSGG